MRLFLMLVVLLMVQYKTFGQSDGPLYIDYHSLESIQLGASQLVSADSQLLVGTGLVLIGSYTVGMAANNPYNEGVGGYVVIAIGGALQVSSFILRTRGHKNLSVGLNGLRLTF